MTLAEAIEHIAPDMELTADDLMLNDAERGALMGMHKMFDWLKELEEKGIPDDKNE